jgi:hypothetical protein
LAAPLLGDSACFIATSSCSSEPLFPTSLLLLPLPLEHKL